MNKNEELLKRLAEINGEIAEKMAVSLDQPPVEVEKFWLKNREDGGWERTDVVLMEPDGLITAFRYTYCRKLSRLDANEMFLPSWMLDGIDELRGLIK